MGYIIKNGKKYLGGLITKKQITDSLGYTPSKESVLSITLLSSNWTESNSTYTQTIYNDSIKEYMNPLAVSMLPFDASVDAQKAYSTAFGILATGSATTADGYVTFKVYKRPAIDISIGLKGV